MSTVKITKHFVETVNRPGVYRDSHISGFCLRVTKSGLKTYAYIGKPKGSKKNITITLGRHERDLRLEEAKARAEETRHQIRQGLNPNVEQRKLLAQKRMEETNVATSQCISLQRVLNDYVSMKPLAPKTKKIYQSLMQTHLADWLNYPLEAITREMIKTRFRDIDSKASSNHVFRVLRAFFRFAAANYDEVYPESTRPLANPVTVLNRLTMWHKVPRRNSYVMETELALWASAVELLDNTCARDLLVILLFTGLRKNEAASLTWDDVNFDERVIFVRQTKNGEPHSLPLPSFLENILRRRHNERESKYVFPGRSNQSYLKNISRPLKQIRNVLGKKFIPHDLRRSFLTTAERLDLSSYAIKALANHKNQSNDVTAGYICSDVERLRLPMERITEKLLAQCKFHESCFKFDE